MLYASDPTTLSGALATPPNALERLICTVVAGHPCDPPAEGTVADPPAGYGGVRWCSGSFHGYVREYGVDMVQLATFLRGTHPRRGVPGALRPVRLFGRF